MQIYSVFEAPCGKLNVFKSYDEAHLYYLQNIVKYKLIVLKNTETNIENYYNVRDIDKLINLIDNISNINDEKELHFELSKIENSVCSRFNQIRHMDYLSSDI